jgi:hypothetical protein
MKYRCISADSHLEIRPDRYTKRVPAKYRDRAPKVIVLENGSLAVLQEGQPLERLISNISCGLPYEERRPFDPAPGETMRILPARDRRNSACGNRTKTEWMPKCCFPAMSARAFGAASETTRPINPSYGPIMIGWRKNTARACARSADWRRRYSDHQYH